MTHPSLLRFAAAGLVVSAVVVSSGAPRPAATFGSSHRPNWPRQNRLQSRLRAWPAPFRALCEGRRVRLRRGRCGGDGQPVSRAARHRRVPRRMRALAARQAANDSRTPVAVSVPILLVYGYFDPATPPQCAERIAGSLPRARLVVARRARTSRWAAAYGQPCFTC